MNAVYVVTYGENGSFTGDFIQPTAWSRRWDAVEAAMKFMDSDGGGRGGYKVVEPDYPHIVKQFSDGTVTYWVERLEVE